jgi:hypothetical protein
VNKNYDQPRVRDRWTRAMHGLMGVDVLIVLHLFPRAHSVLPSIDRLEVSRDLCAMGLEEWGQYKTLAER